MHRGRLNTYTLYIDKPLWTNTRSTGAIFKCIAFKSIIVQSPFKCKQSWTDSCLCVPINFCVFFWTYVYQSIAWKHETKYKWNYKLLSIVFFTSCSEDRYEIFFVWNAQRVLENQSNMNFCACLTANFFHLLRNRRGVGPVTYCFVKWISCSHHDILRLFYQCLLFVCRFYISIKPFC